MEFMSVTTASDAAVDATLASVATAERHIATEYQDDLSLTLATITAEHPRYAMMPEPGRIEVVVDSAGVRDFYVSSRAVFQPAALRIRTQIATDWYFFLEGVASRRDTATGQEFTINSLTLFPAAPDGIVGEFLWERHDSPPSHSDALPPPPGARTDVPVAAVQTLGLHDGLVRALADNDLDALVAPFADGYLMANRSYVPGPPMVTGESRAVARDYWATFLEMFEVHDVAVVNRNATEWYVFAETAIVVLRRDGSDDGQFQQLRTAVFHPLTADGRLHGELGYGTSLGPAPADWRSDRRVGGVPLGRAFYGRTDYRDPLRPDRP
jgi:hypothetical protein